MEGYSLKKMIADPENLDDKTLPVLKQLIEEFPYFQAGWMLYLKNLKNIGSPDFEAELGRVAVRVSDRKKLFRLLNPALSKKEGKSSVNFQHEGFDIAEIYPSDFNPVNPAMKPSLIDQFIQKKPNLRITGIPDTSLANTDLSKESVMENEHILSETYAGILIQQKKYDKAIAAFEKLSLKFPEKSIYFAARIEEVNKLKYNK